MDKSNMRFLFGDRELVLTVGDVLTAAVEVIVNPADSELRHQGGLAQEILQRAGYQLQRESEQLIREYGPIDSGMAVYTSAGDLPYRAIIHAVGPCEEDDDARRLLGLALSRSLQLCDMNEWHSVGFPGVGMGGPSLSIAACAEAYFRAITRFWDARQECAVDKVMVFLRADQFRAFFDAFREQGFTQEDPPLSAMGEHTQQRVGEIDLSEADIAALDDSDIDSWFK